MYIAPIISLLPGFVLLVLALVLAAAQKERPALVLLLLGAAALRVAMISLDPFLHDWDERFHACVAKNMMQHPFQPMLHAAPLLPYDYKDWSTNHIWLHKQPLFLWQMALSMKMFGVHTFALRLPDVLLGTVWVAMIFRMGRLWADSFSLAFSAAFLAAVGYSGLELASGLMALEHNDLAFAVYVTAGLWAMAEYLKTPRRHWAVALGFLVGCAILVKWLTALVVFGGWIVAILLTPALRGLRRTYWDVGWAALVCGLVAYPWQWYIQRAFPLESAWSYEYNRKHLYEDLSHPGSVWYHLVNWGELYAWPLLPLFGLGVALAWKRPFSRPLSAAYLAVIAVIYAFFSWVATKMPAFPYMASAPIFLFLGAGLDLGWRWLSNRLSQPFVWSQVVWTVLLAAAGFTLCRPLRIAEERSPQNEARNIELHNTNIYRNLAQWVPTGHFILNCKAFEDTEIMFWSDYNAYHFYPPEPEFKALLEKNIPLAAFQPHPRQVLPAYTQVPQVKVIAVPLK